MVAAMPHNVAKTTSKRNLTTNDLRSVAIGLAAAVAIVMLASAMTSDSGSVSASESELNDLSAKRFVSISITTVAGDNTVTNAEASAGFTVAGVTDETGEAVTCSYGGVTDSVTADATTGAFSCLFDDDGTGTYADMSGVSDGTVTVFATVSGTNSGNVFATQDTTKPTMTIASAAIDSGDTTNTAAIALTFVSSETTTDFVVTDITTSGCSLSSFSGSGSSYSATCTATGSGAVSVQVAAGAFTDSVTNGNTASNTFAWTADLTAPTLTSVTLNSNNADNDLSIDGNTITLAFTSSETIGTPTCAIKFNGDDATNTETVTNTGGNDWTCTVAAHDSDADGAVTFTLDFTDANGNAGTQVTSTTDSSSVTHDDTVPTLSAVTIAGNGDSTSRTDDGDTITISITSSEAIGTPTCAITINNVAATNNEAISGSGTSWSCTVVTHDSDADGAVAFTLGFNDAAGNAGVAVTATTDGSSVTHDDTAPTLTNIAESTTGTGEANDGDTVSLAITASEAIQQPVCTFASGGANMANSPSYSGSGTGWTASILVADGDTNGDVTFSCTFEDVAGNPGAAADTTADSGDVEVENTHPTVSVFSFSDTAMKTGDTPTLTLTFSEAVVGFASSADVSCPNGALGTMTSANGGVTWTGTFTPTADTEDDTNVCALATSYTDANGNSGPAANTANYAVETLAPSVNSITMSDTALKTGDTSTLTIVFTEAVAGFASDDDVTCPRGSLAAMTSGDSITWSGTFTPSANTDDDSNTCSVGTDYTDTAGNTGTAGTSANYDVDTVAPTVSSIALSDTDVITGDTPTLTIQFSSAVSGFASADDVTCPNGALSTMTSSDSITWTGTFTPSSSTSDDSNTCDVGTGYTDDAGNTGVAGQSANYKVDTIAPSVNSISFNDAAMKSGDTPTLTIVFSEAVAGFASADDVSCPNGALANMASGDSITWTGTFTPTADTEDDTNVCTVATSYTDTLGNSGGGATSANYAVETLKPTATIAMSTSNSNSGFAKSGDTITLTVTMSESVTGLVCTIDGEATTMGGSGTSWTSALTLSGDETEQNTVFSCGSAEDAAGNTMVADTSADTGAVTVDLTAPNVGIGTVAGDGYINAAEASSFTITGTASGANGQTVTVTYGGASETATVSNSGTWTMTMCDDESCSHSAGLSALTANVNDAAGNPATEANINAWYDATAPTVSISGIDISADTGSSATDFITKTAAQTVTATLSAALATGETLQISVNGGTSYSNDDHATGDGTAVSIAGVTLSGTSSIKLRVVDAAGNPSSVATQSYTLDTTAPTLGSMGIATAGTGNANDGDIVTLTFTASETIQSPTCTMKDGAGANMDNSVTVANPSGNTWTCKVTTHNDDANGGMTFSVAFTDVGGTAGVADTTVDDGSSVTIDNTHPTLTAAVLAVGGTGNGNNGDSMTLTITPSEAIGTPTCTFTSGGDAMANSVSYSTSGSDHICTIAVADADTDGAVAITVDFTDSAGNAGTQVTSATSGAVTIDNTHPTISSVSAAWGTHLNAAEDNADKTITVQTSGAANGQTVTTTINGVSDTCSLTGNTCDVTYAASDMANLVSGTSYTIAVDVSDAAGNAATQNTGTSFIYDPTVPTISSIAVTGVTNGQYGNSGSTYTVIVTASETLAAAPTLSLAGGSVGDGTGSSSDAVWTYTFTPTDADEAVTIDVAVGAITDSAGNTNTAAATQFAFTHDATAPTASAVTIAVSGTGNANHGDVVTLTIDPSEAIAAPTCTWTDGSGAMADTSVTYATVEGTDHHTAAVTVDDADQDGTVGFSCTFSDLAGNAVASAVTALTSGSAITIDNTHPTISSVSAAWGSHLNAAEDNADKTITVQTSGAEDGQTVTTTINGVSDTCSVSSNTCDVTYAASDMAGLSSGTSYTIAVDVSDAAGNAATQNTGTTFIYDPTLPTVSSIAVTGVTSGQYGNSGSTYTVIVTASEALSAAPTLSVAGGSVGSGTGSSSDTVWTYTFTPTDADEAVTIDVAAGAITDSAGNDNTAAATQFAFTHDATKPTLTISISSDGSGSSSIAGDTISLTITASEAVTDLVCTIGGQSTTMGGSGTSWTSSRELTGNENTQIFKAIFKDR